MRFYCKIFAFFILLLFAETLFSQSAGQALEAGQDVNVLFRNEATGNVSAHTRGFSANYRRLWHVTGTRKRLIEFELLNMRHPKEQKVKHDHGKSYNYGKLNNLTAIKNIVFKHHKLCNAIMITIR